VASKLEAVVGSVHLGAPAGNSIVYQTQLLCPPNLPAPVQVLPPLPVGGAAVVPASHRRVFTCTHCGRSVDNQHNLDAHEKKCLRTTKALPRVHVHTHAVAEAVALAPVAVPIASDVLLRIDEVD
jgi:hypothetical protein